MQAFFIECNMKFLTINDLKVQLGIEISEESMDEDVNRDLALHRYLDAAFERIQSMLNKTIVEEKPIDAEVDWEKSHIVFNNQLSIAQLLIASDWFNNREETQSTSKTKIPTGADSIIATVRRWNL